MFWNHSIKNIARSKSKSVLFFVLITSLTLILALGVSVWASVENFLDDCKENFMTIGLVEYMGEDYPNDTAYDSYMADALKDFDKSVLYNSEYVLNWDASARAFGYIDGYSRYDNDVANHNYCVFVISGMKQSQAYGYSGRGRRTVSYGKIDETLYSFYEQEGHLVYFDALDFVPDFNKSYIVVGEFKLTGSYNYVNVTGFDCTAAHAAGVDLTSVPGMLDITTADGGYEIPEVYRDIAETFRVINNGVEVTATNELRSVQEFHQQTMYLTEGRYFTEQEYELGSKVCIVSSQLAETSGKKLGDRINLSLASLDGADFYNAYYAKNGFTSSGEYTIVGLTNNAKGNVWNVYIPKSDDIAWGDMQLGYTLGQVVIDNDYAAEYIESVAQKLPDNLLLTVYDQGYSTVVEPLGSILRVAKIVSVVCGVAALAVLVLFGFLFVFRQKDAALTMLALGTRRGQVLRYFIYGSGAIALCAASLGSLAAYLSSGLMTKAIAWIAEQFKVTDSRYSVGALTSSLGITFSAKADILLFALIAAAVFGLAILFCLGFALGSFKGERASRQNHGPKRERRSSAAFGGRPVKYSLLSLVRSGARSAVVPLLALAIVFFLGQLANTANKYKNELYEINAATDVEGKFTDINGKQMNGLVLEGMHLRDLVEGGYVTDMSYSYELNYRYVGTTKLADGTEFEVAPMQVPEGGFSLVSFKSDFEMEPDMVFTNNIRKTGEFYYSENVEFEFLDGYDESVMAQKCDGDYKIMLSTEFMARHGIQLGDTVRIAVIAFGANNSGMFVESDYYVVGSFVKQRRDSNAYCQLDAWVNIDLFTIPADEVVTVDSNLSVKTGYLPEWMVYGGYFGNARSFYARDLLSAYTFRTGTFTVPDAFKYAEFKDFLTDYGFSAVNRAAAVREFIVLDDQSYNETVSTLEQQIVYINILYPILYLLIGVVGFVVSYLLIIGRKKEFAVMRGVGADERRTFLTFFWEQAVLCLLGCVLGFAVWFILYPSTTALHPILACFFALCYFAGCAVSIRTMNRSAVLAILSDED